MPPSIDDDAGSEGFVDFVAHVRPNVFKKGEKLCNTAYIYLITDESYAPEPIITSTVCSSVDDGIGVVPVPEPLTGITVGPNPANSSIEINNDSELDHVLVITNALGQ